MSFFNRCLFIFLFFFLVDCKKENPAASDSRVTANNFLSSQTYSQLVVEIQSVNNYSPSAAALDNLKTFLLNRLNKPKGISFVQNNISSAGKTSYSLADIKEMEKSYRTQHTKGNTLSAYFIFVDGEYAGNSGGIKVLGITYAASSVVIFEKSIKELTGGIGQPSATSLETTVIEHEFGHLLGLVNYGTPAIIAHQSNGYHCNNTDCLMYYTAETSDIVANLLGGNIPSLDANCIKDLRANGGK